MSDEPDLRRLPSGQLAWRALVDHISNIDATAERHFYEIKSDIDLNTNEGRAKVAKFILGAANRDPDQAAARFDGRALMFFGIGKQITPGVTGFEAMDLQRYVRKFTGTPGPSWDFERIDVGKDRAVIVVIVGPPDATKQPWICESEGLEKLFNGRVYIRGDGDTREATAEELKAILGRVKAAARPKVDLDIEVVGVARTYYCDPDVLDRYIERMRRGLLDALPKPSSPVPKESSSGVDPTASLSAVIAGFAVNRDTLFGLGATSPEPRSKQEYLAEIDSWEADVRLAFLRLLDKAVGCLWQGVAFRVTNGTDTYLDEPEFNIHIDGPVEARRKRDRDDLPNPADELPDPPRRWGPISQMSSLLAGHRGLDQIYVPRIPAMSVTRHGRVNYKNGGSVNLSFTLGALRPRATETSDDDDCVLVSRERNLTELHGTWTATIKGRDGFHEGGLSVQVHPDVFDLSSWIEKSLRSDDEIDEDGDEG